MKDYEIFCYKQRNKSVSNIYRKQAMRSKRKFLVNQDMLSLFTRLSYKEPTRKIGI